MAKDIKMEIKKYKEFHVDYLRIFKETINRKNEIISNQPFNLSSRFEKISAIPVKNRTINYNNEVIRLQYINKVSNTFDNLKNCKDLWELHFVRIKTNSISGIATAEGDYDEGLLNQKLDPNQYLADGTACLYDGEKNLIIIARNRDAVLPSAILEFFKKVLNEQHLVFAVIPNESNIKNKESSIYRRLVVGIKNVKDLDKKDAIFLKKNIPSVYNAINSFEGFGYCNIKIELTMGDEPKNVSMNNEMVKNTGFKLMESGIKNLNKVEIATKEDINTKVETIDLINNKVKDNFKIGFTRKNPILYKNIISSLFESYNKKKELIDKLIK